MGPRPPALLALVLLIAGSFVPDGARGEEPSRRTVRLLRGDLHTTRRTAAFPRRQQREQQGSVSMQLVVLGTGDGAQRQQATRDALSAVGAILVGPYPPDHLLIRASPQQLSVLQARLPYLTSAALPAGFKRPVALEQRLQAGTEWAADSSSSSGKAVVSEAAPTATTSSAPNDAPRVGASQPRAAAPLPELMHGLHITWLPGGDGDGGDGDDVAAAASAACVTLVVLGDPPSALDQQEEAQQARAECLREWQGELRSTVEPLLAGAGCDASTQLEVQLISSSWAAAHVTVCVGAAQAASEALSQRADVLWLDLLHEAQPSTNLLAAVVSQTGCLPDPLVDVTRAADLLSTYLPLWGVGLDGRGHTLGVGDDGLDVTSCYMRDYGRRPYVLNSGAVNVTTEPTSGRPLYKDLSRRKVTHWLAWADFVLGTHGTHTSGTLAGACMGDNATAVPDYATGMAPGAKLFFFDGGNSVKKSLAFPSDPEQALGAMYREGVRVVSYSWNYPTKLGYADSDCVLLDDFLRTHDDMLVVFSAGNNGTNMSALATMGQASSPATCKNLLAVGATLHYVTDPSSQYLRRAPDRTRVTLPLSAFKPSVSRLKLQLKVVNVSGDWSQSVWSASLLASGGVVEWQTGGQASYSSLPDGATYQVVLARPDLQACTGTVGNATNKVVLFARGNCSFAAKGRAVLGAGAAGGLMVDLSSSSLILASASDLMGPTPFATISLAAGQKLISYLGTPGLVANLIVNTWKGQPYEQVASFSSAGLLPDPDPYVRGGQDLRIKPDLVAPGYLRSAATTNLTSAALDASTDPFAQDDCATVNNQGTSMAAPVVAGSALLVRQYFVDGFYPSGRRCAGCTHSPSAALLRAVLVGGAAAMQGLAFQVNEPLGPPPDVFQGWGRVDLSRSLPLEGVTPPGWRLQVVDRVPVPSVNASYNFTVAATGAGPLSVTLAWSDFPPFGMARFALVNDLDLRVEYLGRRGGYYASSYGPGRGERWAGGSGAVKDGDGGAAGPGTKGRMWPPGPGPRGAKPAPPPGPTSWWGNMGAARDRFNNVERVYLEAPQPGEYRIRVSASYLYVGSKGQNFSLAVLGHFNGSLEGPQNPMPQRYYQLPVYRGGGGSWRGRSVRQGDEHSKQQQQQQQQQQRRRRGERTIHGSSRSTLTRWRRRRRLHDEGQAPYVR